MIERYLQKKIKENLFAGKAILLLGPRQVGKTTLIKSLLSQYEYLFLDGDDPTVRKLLDEPNTEQLRQIIGAYKIVFIDEAQRIPGIGLTLKIITDQFRHVQVLASGSSAFELSGLAQEPLTGRKWTFYLYPVSWNEWEQYSGFLKAEQSLEDRVVHGMYPDVVMNPLKQTKILRELVDSYLFKDVFALGYLKKPEILFELLQALAYQVGNEVSFNELAGLLKIDIKTVMNYVSLMEQAFILFKLTPFSGNLRNEIKSNKKVYFWDNGVRNAVIGDFRPLQIRQDVGILWENFLISERMKLLKYEESTRRSYFWRTTQQQEVDYVEVSESKVFGFEIKWNPHRKVTFPKTFTANYQADNTGITRSNFRAFLSGETETEHK